MISPNGQWEERHDGRRVLVKLNFNLQWETENIVTNFLGRAKVVGNSFLSGYLKNNQNLIVRFINISLANKSSKPPENRQTQITTNLSNSLLQNLLISFLPLSVETKPMQFVLCFRMPQISAPLSCNFWRGRIANPSSVKPTQMRRETKSSLLLYPAAPSQFFG
jgi:hypothetical protein